MVTLLSELDYLVGLVVKSVAGRDKNRFYVIIKICGNRVYIADGKVRKLGCLKSKNLIHIKKTNKVIDVALFETDRGLRRVLHDYNYGDYGEKTN